MPQPANSAPVSLGSPRFLTMECPGFLVTDATFPSSHEIERHFHDRAVVGITLRGEWDSIVGATHLDNAPGTLHVEPAGDSHVNRFGAAGAHVLVIQPDRAHGESLGSLLATAFRFQVGAPGIAIARRLQGELQRPDDLTPLSLEGLSLDLLVFARRKQRSQMRAAANWMGRVIEYLHGQFLQQPTLAQLATLAGVSPAHLNREFRRTFRVGAAEYIRDLRLDWAAERLRHHHEKVAEIAAASGFADQSHVTRRFRARFGTTPAAFRASRD